MKDVVRANVAAIHRGDQQIIQIGTAASTSIGELVNRLHDIHGVDFSVLHKQERAGDIKHSCLNNAKANSHLAWKPNYDLYRGLQETYRYAMGRTDK